MGTAKILRILSAGVVLLICWSSWEGLNGHEIYARETGAWALQAMGQDVINLYIIPFYVFTALLLDIRKGQLNGLWVGTTGYFIYTYFIYCLDIRFNHLFLLYVAILGLLTYSLIIFFYFRRKTLPAHSVSRKLRILTATYFIFIAVLFSFIWLSEIIPAIVLGTIPESLQSANTPTNPVHVLDLSLVLPGILIAGILLIRNKKTGYFLASAILTFSLLMELTIASLSLILSAQGQATESGVVLFMFFMTATSLALLAANLKHTIVRL